MPSYKDIQKQGTPIPGHMHIRYKGAWDMQDLYESIASHLRERKWHFFENVYKHKHPSPFGVERQYIWTAEQDVDEWVKIKIDIYIHTYDAHDIEIVGKDGERRIYTQGKIWIVLKLNDIWDPHHHFDTSSFWGQLKDFYIKYIVRKRRMLGYSPRYRHEQNLLYMLIQRRLRMESRDFEYSDIAGVHRRGP